MENLSGQEKKEETSNFRAPRKIERINEEKIERINEDGEKEAEFIPS